jgi:excisionase family DNA binding protein
MLHAVPTLDDLAANPERIAELDASTAWALLVKLMGLQMLLLARAGAPTDNGHGEASGDLFLTVKETARLLKVPQQFVYELARRNEIPTVKVGRHIRVPLGALKKHLTAE